jgi:hypothetical protein
MALFEAAKAWDGISDLQRLESSGVTYADGARIFQIRNPKHEIRNKSQFQISKALNTTDQSSLRSTVAAGVRVCVSDIRISDFEFVSDFGFRVSDFASPLLVAARPR